MSNGNHARKQKWNAMWAVLALALAAAAPLAAAAGGGAEPAAEASATLTAFADGQVSRTIAFGAGAQSDTSLALRMPHDAVVASAALDARVAGDSAVSSGALVFDVGADGSQDATASVTVLGETRVALPAAAIQAYLDAAAAVSGGVDVPVGVTGAAAAQWSVVLNGLAVEYSTRGNMSAAPTFNGSIGDIVVVAGETNGSAVDLSAYFEAEAGADLRYSAVVEGGGGAAAAAGVAVHLDGALADIQASDAGAWGEATVRFAAADASGQVALSNNVTVHVVPAAPTAPTVWTEARAAAEAVVVLGCGSPSLVERFQIPADAIVTEAAMTLNGSLGLSLLGITLDVLAMGEVVAGVNASELPREVELNTTAINQRLRAQASAFGLADLDLAADVCPTGGLSGLTASNVTVTFVRGAANGTQPPAPVIAEVSIEGEADGRVESDTGLTLALESEGGEGAGTQVAWFVDGEVFAEGEVAEGVSLCEGEHTIEARATTSAGVHTYRKSVNATPREGVEAQIAINGVVTAAVDSGTELILELRTPRPMAAGAEVEWYVDGKFAGRGQVLADVVLTAGVHSVEARESSNGSVQTYAAQVTALPVESAPLVPPAMLVGALLAVGLLAAGVALSRRRRRGAP
ncbi:MAG TPA: hypothetical protein VGB42_04470 [Candidatus Thermoplasmatota archaeon]